MNNYKTSLPATGVVTRVTALWAFSEAFLGGILHGFKVPFAGLALSLVAAICMALIAVYDSTKAALLKATLVVIAVKFVLSPQTPPMAYVAVLVEGLAGEMFLLRRRSLHAGAFFLSVFCLLYSAFQHLLILTIVFGKDFWNALDIFLNGITKSFISKSQHYSLYLVLFYVGCYFVAGIAGGVFCNRLIRKIQSGKKPPIIEEFANTALNQPAAGNATGKNKKVSLRYILAGLLLLLLVASYTPLFSGTVLKSKTGEVILRGLLIMLAWNFLLSPLLIAAIGNWVNAYKNRRGEKLREIIALLPGIKTIVQFSWQKTANTSRYRRLQQFLSNTVMLIVYG